MKDSENSVKILFRFYSDVLEQETRETMWAITVDENKGFYKLDNIPFYVPSIASDDIVLAEYDEDELMLIYRETIEYSGNSTVRIVILNKTININDIIKNFSELGCILEKLNDHYLTMEVPAKVDYKNIKQKLEELELNDLAGYEESCLSSIHQY